MKKLLVLLFILIMSVATVSSQDFFKIMPSQIGVVETVKYVDIDENIAQVKQLAEIRLTKGDFKDKKILVDNILTGNPYYDINLKTGMKVLVHMEQDEDGIVASVENIYRSGVLILLALLFCGLLLYVGKRKGLFSLISIIITCVLIFYLLTPLVLHGVNPVFATFLITLISTSLTLYSVGGFNRKSTAAIFGCLLSIVFACVLAFITVKLAFLTGFNSESSMFLYSSHPELNFVALAIAMILLATLGAVMDIAMSIASTINEIYSVDNTKTVRELFKSGMNVGRDIIGTMANTLILVYLGSSLPLILLANNIDMQKFFNLNYVVTEIASALIGSSAIVICVPITAIVASQLIKNLPANHDFTNLDA